MFIGLDVGGTHTDAVLVRPENREITATVKVPTHAHDMLPGLLEALAKLLEGHDPATITRVSVSTTLGINALLTGQTARVGMLVLPGPGIDPRLFWGLDPLFYVLEGAQDHRGRVTSAPKNQALSAAFALFREHGAEALGIVCKFSPKNSYLERALAARARAEMGPDVPLVLGSEVSSSLNFPRRMNTVWCNAALGKAGEQFIRALERATRALGLACPLMVLKADAGVFSAAESIRMPASGMGSGPAASLLGVWALSGGLPGALSASGQIRDLLMIDMGGTSTDMALLAGGQPLLAGAGFSVRGRLTLIRSLWTRSLALGGDSSLRVTDGLLRIGPDRLGPALAFASARDGQRPPTLTDALNTLGLAHLGDTRVSRRALAMLAAQSVPEKSPKTLARSFLAIAMRMLKKEADALLKEVNARPVYTIRELLVREPLCPKCAVFIGGPAYALSGEMEKILGLPVVTPAHAACANALGAALARPTRAAGLYADTVLGRMDIPEFNVQKTVGRGYTLEQAKEDLLAAFARESGGKEHAPAPAAQIVSAESFAMLDDEGCRGRVIRVRAQHAASLHAVEKETTSGVPCSGGGGEKDD